LQVGKNTEEEAYAEAVFAVVRATEAKRLISLLALSILFKAPCTAF
jgi:hypothetical protein